MRSFVLLGVLGLALSLQASTAKTASLFCPQVDQPVAVEPAATAFVDDLPKVDRDLTPTEIYASRVYQRLTGASAPILHPRFRKIISLLDQGQKMEAFRLMTADKNFLNIRMRNFAAPFSNKEFSPQEPFNDLQALIIGITRDEMDARLLLTGDIRYSGYRSLRLPAVSRANNDHYTQFDAGGYDLATDLELVKDQWEDLDFGAGALTTRTWAKAHYIMGTNRRGVEYSFSAFLCSPIQSWKQRGLPDYFVRRDVPRNPEGNPETYQNVCRNCHAPMDAMGGAFAKLDFVNNTFTYMGNAVAAKMNQLADHYPAGYVTTDDSWNNFLTADFGWRSAVEGVGIKAFGEMLANSAAFSRCMTTKVFKEVCGKNIVEESPELLKSLAADFEANNYNLKYLFIKAVSLNECVNN